MADKADKTEKAAKKKGGKKLVPLIAGVIALVLIAVVAKSVLGGHKPGAKEKKAPVEVGISIPLDEFLVNLNGGDHYLRTTIALGMKKGITEEETKDRIAPVRDAILGVLSTKTLDDLNKPKDRDSLKDELKSKINEATGDDSVAKVYFTAFATQ